MASATTKRGAGLEHTDMPILSNASKCGILIQRLAEDAESNMLETQALAEDWERRFRDWWEYLRVFAKRRRNLDWQLRDKPQIRDMILQMLEMLRRNLEYLDDDLHENSSDVESLDESDEDDEDLESPLTIAVDAIDSALRELGRLGIEIRRSAKTTETSRARDFATKHLNLKPFEAVCFLAVESLYPNAPSSLHRRLSQTMVDRYARLQLRSRRHAMLQTEVRPESPVRPRPTSRREPTAEISDLRRNTASHINQASVPPESQQEPSVTIELTSVDASRILKNIKDPPKQRSRRGATTVILGSLQDPPVPQFHGCEEIECQWCFGKIHHDLVQNNSRWTNSGREHYRRDLEPFSCLSVQCEDNFPSFASARSWREHMRSSHSRNWAQFISNRSMMWRCPNDSHGSGTELYEQHETDAYFTTEDHLYWHLRKLHWDSTADLDEPALLAKVKEAEVTIAREANTCPLCWFTPKGLEPEPEVSAVSQITQTTQGGLKRQKTSEPTSVHKRRRAHLFGSESTTVDQLDSEQPDPSDSIEAGDSGQAADSEPLIRAMEKHIMEHLQFLMIVSLRLIDTQTAKKDAKCEPECTTSGESSSASQVDGSGTDWDMDVLSSLSFDSSQHSQTSNELSSLGFDLPQHSQITDEAKIEARNEEGEEWGAFIEDRQRLHSELNEKADPILAHIRAIQKPSPPTRRPSGRFKDRQACLNSLLSTHKAPSRPVHSGTCHWFFESPEFQQWWNNRQDPKNGLLWIKGKPGAGKATLMNYVTAHSRETFEDHQILACSFEDSSRYPGATRNLDMLKSLLEQLLENDSGMMERFMSKYESMRQKSPQVDGGWPESEIETLQYFLLSEAWRGISKPIFLIVSGFHWCEERESTLAFLLSLKRQSKYELNICVSTRHYPHLDTLKSIIIVVENKSKYDIASYVGLRLRDLNSNSRRQITARASGMFLWVEQMVEKLSQELVTDDEVVSRIEETPVEVEGTFDRLLQNPSTDTILILQWVLFAAKPLLPKELYAAVQAGTTSQELAEWGRPRITEADINWTINHASRGLLEFGGQSLEVPLVRFIHPSVKDFLLGPKGLQMKDPELQSNVIGASHQRLRDYCMSYIMSYDIEHSFSFQLYAKTHLFHHAEQAHAHGIDQKDFIHGLYEDPTKFERLGRFFDSRMRTSNEAWRQDTSLLYGLACYGHSRLVKILLDLGVNPSPREDQSGNPLRAAAYSGHLDIVRLLVKYGADVNSANALFGTALEAAAFSGHIDIVRFFLENGANVNATGGRHGSALQAGAFSGHVGMVRFLLDHGADVNGTGGLHGSAVRAAHACGYRDIVSLLIHQGATTNTRVGGHLDGLLQDAPVFERPGSSPPPSGLGADPALRSGRHIPRTRPHESFESIDGRIEQEMDSSFEM